MTVHPHANEFKGLEQVCDAARVNTFVGLYQNTLHTGGPVADLLRAVEENESRYRDITEKIVSNLQGINIPSLAAVHRTHFDAIIKMYNLFKLDVNPSSEIRVNIPEHWVHEYSVTSEAQGYEGDIENFCDYSDAAVVEASSMSHKQLLAYLMPNNQSLLHHEKNNGASDVCFTVDFPPPPDREWDIMYRLQQAGIPFMITADSNAIAFTPPAADQMRNLNQDNDILAQVWLDFEPIITVEEDDAVVIVGQWGEYIFETMAVQAAIEAL